MACHASLSGSGYFYARLPLHTPHLRTLAARRCFQAVLWVFDRADEFSLIGSEGSVRFHPLIPWLLLKFGAFRNFDHSYIYRANEKCCVCLPIAQFPAGITPD